MAKSKFQKDEIITIQRSQIKNAPYNPRIISEEAKKRLKKGLKKHGLVSTLTWNKRTGNLVSGHRRLETLDILEKNQDYDLHVSMIDVDEKDEVEINVQLNNPSMQGEWDIDALSNIVADFDIDFGDLGFSNADAEVLFGGDSRLADLFHDTDDVLEAKHDLSDIKKHRKDYIERVEKEQGADFILTIVASNADEKSELCKLLKVPAYEQFMSAAKIFDFVKKSHDTHEHD
jgi:ParB-like chromosome segregation protein Spo0J